MIIDEESKKAIHRSLESGINFFDTADIYGLGHSEQLLGETLAGNKDVIIATKVGNVARAGQFTVDYSKEYILEACDESLRRLKRETIDYYQLHSARLAHLQQGECLQAMDLLQWHPRNDTIPLCSRFSYNRQCFLVKYIQHQLKPISQFLLYKKLCFGERMKCIQ